MSLILSLLWHPDSADKQLTAVAEADIRGLDVLIAQRGTELSNLAPSLKLPLIELCLPTLKLLSSEQYDRFKRLLLQFIRADGRIDLFEWCLFQLVRHYLDPEFVAVRPSKPRYNKLAKVSDSLAVALGTLATLGEGDTLAAFQRGATSLNMALTLPAVDQMGVQAFSKAVDQLANCYPLLKVDILKAMAEVAKEDGSICHREMTLVKAIAAVIDCPIPSSMLPRAD